MLLHGREELAEGPCIQTEGQMLVCNLYSIGSNHVLYRLLNGSWKNASRNERTTLVIGADNGQEVLLRQIAGLLARRIVWYVARGMWVTQGQEFGFIKFGSRVDVLPPLGTENDKAGCTATRFYG